MFLNKYFILINLLNAFLASSTQCMYNGWNINDEDNLQQIDQSWNFDDQGQYVTFGQGFWFQFLPYRKDYLTQINDQQLGLNIINYFLYSLRRISDDSQHLFIFLQLNKIQKTINYIIYIYTDQSIITKIIPIDIINFEGVWIFFYFYNHYEDNQISFYYYQSNLDLLYQESLDSIIKIQNIDTVKSSIRYFLNIKVFGEDIITFPFLGIIKEVENTFINILEDLVLFKEQCFVEFQCIEGFQNLNLDSSQNNNNFAYQQLSYMFTEFNTFKLSGWAKQNKLDVQLKLDSLLMRITINENNFNDQQIGDKFLYVVYHQDSVLSQTGFTAQTYSYSFPYTTLHQTTQDETFKIQDGSLSDLLTQWHFIQYEEGSSINEGKPIYRVYFPQNDEIIECKWNNQVYHFSAVNLYFYIGGDDYSTNKFNGQLNNWNVVSYCQKYYESIMEITCFYSCQTCKGLSQYDCLSCPQDSNRIFSSSDNTCSCQIGYIDIYGVSTCLTLTQFNGALTLQVKEVICEKHGFYKCFQDQILCDFGYFPYNNQCLQCPQYQGGNNQNSLYCGECYLDQENFHLSLECSFDFLAKDDQSPFYQIWRDPNKIEIFQIQCDNQNVYSLKFLEGNQGEGYCRNGFFMNEQGICQNCVNGCFSCLTYDYCSDCLQGYSKNDDGQCIKCQICSSCIFEEGNEICVDLLECLPNQYMEYQKCNDCGQYCNNCNSEQCYYCIDNQRNYLSIDSWNCGYCSIQYCQYCFEYIYLNDGSLIISIDINRDFIQLDTYEIQLGCAQCIKGYFYSFETKKCEKLRNDDMKECDVGVSLDESQGIICLKSSSMTTSIQQVYCEDTVLCQECINNYTFAISSFCIICKEGYYSNIQTGICKQCPSSCKTCAQRNIGMNDQWKWDIKAFYLQFANLNGNHPFETYATNSDLDYLEIVCLSCQGTEILYKNECIQGCSANCQDCRIVDYGLSVYRSHCYKCKSSLFNSLRSFKFNNINQLYDQCEICPKYCQACYFRESEEISKINKFFDQESDYRKYTYPCYKKQDKSYGNIYIVPNSLVIQQCNNFQKCSKGIDVIFKVFIDFREMKKAMNLEKNQTLHDRFVEFRSMMTINPWNQFEEPEFLEYYNQEIIEEININYYFQPATPSQFWQLQQSGGLSNRLKEKVFLLKKVTLKLIGDGSQIPFKCQDYLTFFNFDQITFQDINFYAPITIKDYQEYDIVFRIIIQNEYYPMSVRFQNVNFLQFPNKIKLDFYFQCNRPKHIHFIDVEMTLNITDSVFFNYEPFADFQDSTFYVENFTLQNNLLNNVTIFQFSASNSFLNCTIQFKNVTILNTFFINNSSFINSNYNYNYDIGVVHLENFLLKDVTFQNASIFLKLLSCQTLTLKNFTLYNIKFLDSASFLIANTFDINEFKLQLSIIQFGFILSNKGKFSESLEVINHSQHLNLKNIIIQDNQYFKENQFIYIIQDQVSNISLHIENFEFNQNYYHNIQIGTFAYNFSTSSTSQIYIECSQCYFNNLTIIRGLGYPEFTIINSNHISIVNLKVQLNPSLNVKFIHTSINCVKQYYSLDLPHIIYIQSFHYVLLDKIIIQNSINVDYPFIQIIGERYSDQNKFDQIIIQNSIFQSNNLIITQLNRISSIISIQTSLDTQIEAKNITFKDNLLNKFEDDPQLHSSSTLFIDSQIGSVVFQNIRFLSNSVLNTSDSNLYIKTDNLTLSECHFSNQNMLNMQLIQQYILFEEFQSEKEKIMSNILVIFSTGGSGLFYINKLLIQQINVTNSLAVNGGAFFIVVKSIGIIQIQNSTFENTSTLLDGNQFSSGGAFYIDASKSRLILSISDTIIQKAYSRTQGGAIYIEASRAFNEINFINLQIENSFSLQHSILSYYPYKLSSLPSNILINNCSFKSNEHEFNYYLSKIQDISIQDVQPFQINNPAIYTQFSNFSIFNTQFNSIHLSFLIQIQHGINVNLINISISNTTIFKSPLIKILLREDVNAQLNVENLKVNFIQEYKFQQILNCTPEKRDDQYKFLCPINASTIISRPNLIFHQQDATNQLNCNKDLVYTQSQYNFSLFELKKSSQTHKIVFYNIQFTQCDCPSCYFGLVSIQEFSFSTLNLKLKSMQFLNNNCGTLGCLSILKVVENNTSINQGSNRILTDDDLSKLEFQQLYNFQVKMQDSIFYNNTAQFGGACYFSSVNILLDNCRMKFNLAYETGGGIFVNANNTRIIIINSEIVNNKANIAGGLYLKNDQLQNPQQLHLILKENYANISENSYEAPTSLKTQIQNQIIDKSVNLLKNSTTIIDEVLITPYQSLDGSQILTQLLLPSGMRISHYKYFDSQLNGYRSSNLTFRILPFNSIGEQIKNLNGSYCSIFAQEISTKNDDYFKQILLDENLSQQYLSQTKILFNQTTQNYNLDELIIYFNPMKDIDSKLLLAIKCDSIQVPQYNNQFPYDKTHVITDYFLLIKLRTFKCQLGEYLNSISGGCVECDITQNQYSVTLDASKCQFKNDVQMKSLQPAMIELREGFWRAFYYSSTIEECYHLKLNCLGGWYPGDNSCSVGHLGALCEQCDLYDIQGNGSFSQGQSYTCSSCEDMAGNIVNIVFAVSWTILSVFLSVSSTITMIEEFILYTKMRTIDRYLVFKSSSTSVLIKVFTNYLQIIGSISTFQLSIPIGIIFAFKSVGNPIETMSFSLDCYLSKMTSIPIHYFRILWGFFMIACYIFLFIGLHLLLLFYHKKQLSITFITTTLIYIYIYLSPNLISGLVALLSYRIISDQKWITANVAHQYDTQQHYIWLQFFALPLFIIIGIVLPIFFWFIVYYHRNCLNKATVRKKWGYLYNEYKLDTYYWETIKILQKELIIYVLIYYEDYVTIKASLIFFVLLLYGKLTNKYKPYQTGDLNQIDALQTSICNISIILAQTIFTAQNLEAKEIVLPCYAIMAVLNFYFFVKVIIKIIFAYFNKLEDQIDEVKAYLGYKFPKFLRKNQFCLKYLNSNKNRKQIIRKRFQLIKAYLLKQAKTIIQYRQTNTVENGVPNFFHEQERISTDQMLGSTQKQLSIFKINTKRTLLKI